ncbi:Protein of unknown function [Desulfatibacillum alkenivorans DSM 16219]|jgi:hypothetical protein|uniref:DUF3450 domain-containing protein n=1 Tax=Desulfatibacillum alkenivorans DSM 16219 TaxID=1121393 RepID=A0A1M6NA38_9BACT|nr:DUF3450 domain-containing protein [Desulfatibacillum alkenivorans]SHJ92563.1 Protein of unknown function [Desulfatibacillum alkenivorans DSM 16219]
MFRPFYIMALLLVSASPGWCDNFAQQVREPVAQAVEIRKQTQASLDDWSEEKARLTARYKSLGSQNARLKKMRDAMQTQVNGMTNDISELEQKKADILAVSKGLEPVLEESFQFLAYSVEASQPFLKEERTRRMDSLKQTMEDPETSLGEKYRRISEALLIEAQYGGTAETQRRAIMIQNEERMVDVLRLGRLSIFFRTLNQDICGMWDPASAQFVALPPEHNAAINQAVEMAAKRRPADILLLPLGEAAAQ